MSVCACVCVCVCVCACLCVCERENLLLNDSPDGGAIERVENDVLIQAVQELRPKMTLHRLRNLCDPFQKLT